MSGKSPSAWRVAVIAGACAVLASAMTPVSAASPVNKGRPAPSKKEHPSVTAKRAVSSTAGGSGMLSLEWTITALLRP